MSEGKRFFSQLDAFMSSIRLCVARLNVTLLHLTMVMTILGFALIESGYQTVLQLDAELSGVRCKSCTSWEYKPFTWLDSMAEDRMPLASSGAQSLGMTTQ
jgi:hypothetical protein